MSRRLLRQPYELLTRIMGHLQWEHRISEGAYQQVCYRAWWDVYCLAKATPNDPEPKPAKRAYYGSKGSLSNPFR